MASSRDPFLKPKRPPGSTLRLLLMWVSLSPVACSHHASCSADADFSTSRASPESEAVAPQGGDSPAAVAAAEQGRWPMTRLTGPVRSGPRGPQLLLGPQQVPVLLHPAPQGGATLESGTFEGRFLPAVPPTERGSGPTDAQAGGAPPASRVPPARWLLSEPKRTSPELPATVPPLLPTAVVIQAWPELEPCLRAVHRDLGDELSKFWVDLNWQRTRQTLVIPLWHEQTIRQSPGTVGDASGKSRNAVCNLATGEITSYQYWQ